MASNNRFLIHILTIWQDGTSSCLWERSHGNFCMQDVTFDITTVNYDNCGVVEPALTGYVRGALVTDYNLVLDQLASATITDIVCTDCKLPETLGIAGKIMKFLSVTSRTLSEWTNHCC